MELNIQGAITVLILLPTIDVASIFAGCNAVKLRLCKRTLIYKVPSQYWTYYLQSMLLAFFAGDNAINYACVNGPYIQGAITAVFLVANIGASLIAVLAFIAFINGILVKMKSPSSKLPFTQ
jgi:hypothetical protein